MEKAIMFSTRDDEIPFMEKENEKYGFEVTYEKAPMTMENIQRTKGIGLISVSSAYPINEEMLKILQQNGVRYIATRATGHNHVDTELAKAYGIRLGYVPKYSPNSISEFAVAMALAVVRNMKAGIMKGNEHDFTYAGLMGKQIKGMTVGVIGDGNIGFEVIKSFYGMGCKVLTMSRHEKTHVMQYAQYVDFEELIRSSDIITLHCPLTETNKNMLNEEAFEKMKDGVYIINTARGGLIDHMAMRKYLDSGKVAGFGMDVYVGEGAYIRKDLSGEEINEELFLDLIHRPNVIYMPHIAFLTEEAVSTIEQITFSNMYEFVKKGASVNDLW